MVIFPYYSLGGDTATPNRLYSRQSRLSHAFLVTYVLNFRVTELNLTNFLYKVQKRLPINQLKSK